MLVMLKNIAALTVCLALVFYHLEQYLTSRQEKFDLHRFGKLNAMNNFIVKEHIPRVMSCHFC